MAKDDVPSEKAKGKEPVKDEQAHGVNGTKEPHEKTTADGKKPADIEFAAGSSSICRRRHLSHLLTSTQRS